MVEKLRCQKLPFSASRREKDPIVRLHFPGCTDWRRAGDNARSVSQPVAAPMTDSQDTKPAPAGTAFDIERLSQGYDGVGVAADYDAGRGSFDNRAQQKHLLPLLVRPPRISRQQALQWGRPAVQPIPASLQEIGFRLRSSEYLEIGGETMLWLLVQRPA